MPRHHFSRPRGRVIEIAIDSRALASNLLGDPTTRVVAVYLPEGYDQSGEDYPLFVDLVGFTGSGLGHLNWRAFDQSVPCRIDRLIDERRMGPVVVAFPDCFTSLGGNQYINSDAMGRWADFLIDEMLPRLERELRLRRGREHRAVFGKSSGGYGALAHALRYADHWNAAACHSGDIGFDLVYRGDFPRTLNQLARFDRDIPRFLQHVADTRKLNDDESHALMILAMAATYDPDPAAARGIHLPVDLETCALDPIAWERWLMHDPLRLIEQPDCQRSLRRLAGLYLDCGFRDPYHLHFGARALVRRLDALGIAHRYEEFDDNHSSIDYRMDESLPFLYRALTS